MGANLLKLKQFQTAKANLQALRLRLGLDWTGLDGRVIDSVALHVYTGPSQSLLIVPASSGNAHQQMAQGHTRDAVQLENWQSGISQHYNYLSR